METRSGLGTSEVRGKEKKTSNHILATSSGTKNSVIQVESGPENSLSPPRCKEREEKSRGRRSFLSQGGCGPDWEEPGPMKPLKKKCT